MSRPSSSTGGKEWVEATVEEKLERAELLAGDRREGERAATLAREILADCLSGPPADRARAVLARVEGLPEGAADRREGRGDGAERDRWAMIAGLEDGRLADAWEFISSHPDRLVALRGAVVADLETWIRRLAADLRQPGSGSEERVRVAAVEGLVKTEAFREHLEVSLRPALEELHLAEFACRLASTEVVVQDALGSGDSEAGRRHLEALGTPPAGGDFEVLRELTHEVDAAEERRLVLDGLAASLTAATAPTDAASLRRLLERMGEAAAWLAGDLPSPLQLVLRRAWQQGAKGFYAWLQHRVGAVGDADSALALAVELDRLGDRLGAADLEVSEDRLQPALDLLSRTWRQRVGDLEGPEAVRPWRDELSRLCTRVALAFTPTCRRWLRHLEAIHDEWVGLRRGEVATRRDGEALPARFIAEYQEQEEIAVGIREAMDGLEAQPAGPRRARRLAQSILDRFPHHAQARALQRAAQRLQVEHTLAAHLDALGGGAFDLEGYGEVAGWEMAPEEHRRLAEHLGPLAAVDGCLAAPAWADPVTAARWWTGFADALGQLPPTLPALLERRLEGEARRRRDAWLLVLDRAMSGERPEEEWRRLAAGVEEIAGHPRLDPGRELERYRVELARRADLSRVQALIEAGDYFQARNLLEATQGDSERCRDLGVRLAVDSARHTTDVVELAETLDRHWGRAAVIYGPESEEILEAGLAQAWDEGRDAAVSLLARVARRALQGKVGRGEARLRLRDWLAWIDLEQRLLGGLNLVDAQALVEHLDRAGDRKLGRLAVLVGRWRQEGLRDSCGWAYQAFPDLRGTLFPDGADPAAEITIDREALVDDIDRWFATELDGEGDPLAVLEAAVKNLLARGEALEAESVRLGELLDELPFPVERRSAGEGDLRRRLQRVDNVARLLAELRALASSDLRREGERRSRCHLRLRELKAAPWREHVAREYDRLAPLTRLDFDESRLREAARRCGSKTLIDQPRLFTEVAQWLGKILQALATAGCLGAPVARAMAEEYWQALPGAMGVRPHLTLPEAAGLPDVVELCERLEDDEVEMRRALDRLEDPSVEPVFGVAAGIDAERHRDYLALIPEASPASKRAFWLFQRFAGFAERPALLRAGVEAGLVADWVREALP